MQIDKKLLDSLTEQAKNSPRLRMNLDMRTSSEDSSQRMLNAMEPGTVLPIHRHTKSTEVVVVLRGSVRQNFYKVELDDQGRKITFLEESFVCGRDCAGPMGGSGQVSVFGYSVEVGRWHNTESLESGTVILECKDGRYEPLGSEDIIG